MTDSRWRITKVCLQAAGASLLVAGIAWFLIFIGLSKTPAAAKIYGLVAAHENRKLQGIPGVVGPPDGLAFGFYTMAFLFGALIGLLTAADSHSIPGVVWLLKWIGGWLAVVIGLSWTSLFLVSWFFYDGRYAALVAC